MPRSALAEEYAISPAWNPAGLVLGAIIRDLVGGWECDGLFVEESQKPLLKNFLLHQLVSANQLGIPHIFLSVRLRLVSLLAIPSHRLLHTLIILIIFLGCYTLAGQQLRIFFLGHVDAVVEISKNEGLGAEIPIDEVFSDADQSLVAAFALVLLGGQVAVYKLHVLPQKI